jgi:hypothetical protein
MKKVDVKDNFLNDSEFTEILDVFLELTFPWYFGDVVNPEDKLSYTSDLDNTQMYHMLYSYDQPQSPSFHKMNPIFKKLVEIDKFISLYRMKVNLNQRTSEIIEHGFHNDVEFKCRTGILYLNSNDGYTMFEDGTKIESIKNRFVYFDSDLKHSGTTCTNQKRRMVMNINYFQETYK